MHAGIRHGTVLVILLGVASGERESNVRAQKLSPPSSTAQTAANRVPRLPAAPFNYADPDLPSHFTTPVGQLFDNTPADNPVTDAGATLGRVLFYDTRLSANGTVACASCHLQTHAFDDPRRLSTGFEGGLTDRHAMSLVNLRYYPRGRFFWDERGDNLESMVLLPVANTVEMGQDPARLPAVLSQAPFYPALFQEAFGDPEITERRVARALAQFVRSLVSYQSRYDEGRARAASLRDDFPTFTHQENRGKALFLRHCANCHLSTGDEAHFVLTAPANTGLDADTRSADGGVGDVTLNPRDLGSFKSPSLRNVEVSAPYMHDGRFPTLEAVLEHYSQGGTDHPNKDVRVQPLHLTGSEKTALVAFLVTLTDTAFLADPRFSNPFD
jgi:cytochrome c peroxidase